MMRRTLQWVVGCLVCIVLLTADTAWAQLSNEFVGVSAVGLLVESFDHPDEAARCNVSQGGLDAAARLPLDASRLRITSSLATYVYVNVNVMFWNNSCVASVRVALERDLTIPNTQSYIFGASVWFRQSLIIGPPSDFGSRVNQSITGYTQQLIAEWTKANPRQ